MTLSHIDGSWPTTGLSFGGDYNPEQWDPAVWQEDIRLMHRAGVNLVSLGIFSWGLIEVADGEYRWDDFDTVMDMLEQARIGVDLATPSAAPPAWLLQQHPEILPVDQDMQQVWPGARLGWCPSSPVFRRYSLRIARALAERYGHREHVRMWHVGNEFGGGNRHCYCDISAQAFREWLQKRYGDIHSVNRAWGTAFWGHHMTDLAQVLPPRGRGAKNPALLLDYDRFSSDQLLAQYLAEREVLKDVTPGLPVTTNFMVGAEPDVVDYARWAPHMDVVANDHYTRSPDPLPQQDVAFSGDRMRAMTTGRRPWMLMEHSTSAVNWQPRNRAKLPGELIRNSLSHVAHGADGVLFFQWRASASGAEQFHSAMVPHGGEDTQIFRDVCRLGTYLRALAPVQGSRVAPAQVALLFDDDAGWAMTRGVKPHNELPYGRVVRDWHRAFWRRNIGVDVVPPWADLSAYEVVVVPTLFLTDDETAARVAGAAENGATVVVTFLSGIVDEENRVRLGGYPGAFRDLLGIRVEEMHPLQPGQSFRLDDGGVGTEWTEDIALLGAQSLSSYVDGPLAGRPAVTQRSLPSGGRTFYVSCLLDQNSLDALSRKVLPGHAEPRWPEGLEVLLRESQDATFHFYLNHADSPAHVTATGTELLHGETVAGPMTIPPGEVRVVMSPRRPDEEGRPS